MLKRDVPLIHRGLLIGIFVVLTCVITGTAYWLYGRQREAVKEMRYLDIQSVAQLLAGRIAQWRETCVNTATMAAHAGAADLSSRDERQPSRRDIDRLGTRLRALLNDKCAVSAHFFGADGSLLVRADRGQWSLKGDDGGGHALEEPWRQLALQAMSSRAPVWSGLHTHAPGRYCIGVAVPATSDNGGLLGSVVLLTDATKSLFALADDWQTPLASTETLLILPDDGVMIVLRSGRTLPRPDQRRLSPCDPNDVMVVQALNRRVGHLRALAPGRGEMYGHIRPVPGTGWMVLVREDASEANSPARTFSALWIAIVLACVAASFAALLAVWRHQRARMYRHLYESEIEQHRAEREAFRARAMLELVLNTIPQRVFWKDRDSRYLGCNLPFARDAGFQSPNDLRGKDDYAMSWRENADAYRADDQAVMESGTAKLGYIEPQNRTDGTFAWLRTSKVPLRDDEGNVVGVLGTYEDITAMVLAEEELEQKNRELASVLRSVSHDLRTPLVNLTGYANEIGLSLEELRCILGEVPMPSDASARVGEIVERTMPHDLGVISANAQRMSQMLSGVLDISRIGRMELRTETVRMNELMTDLRESYRQRAAELGAEIIIGPLPNCEGDPVQIARVFDNLLSNALKYLDPSRDGVIRISGQVHQGNSVYCVEDNGQGIRAEHQDRVFDLFWRAQRDAEGEGLGLAIVRSIVTRHGGRVWVESEPGEGSRFYVRLRRPARGGRRRQRH